MERCDDIYRSLGTRIFSKPKETVVGESSWRDRLDNLYTSGQQKWRVAVHGSKHDATLFETLVRQECKVDAQDQTFIDTALLGGPKVFVVSTMISIMPASPFIFRNYQYQESLQDEDSDDHAMPGSCKHLLWQGVRASSAAPYYLADFTLGPDKWQDGAVTCNNPAMLGVMEARRLWPDKHLDCVVSMGSGTVKSKPRDMSSISRIIDAGSVLVESACSIDRVDESLATLVPLIPGAKYYRFNPIDERCQVELDDTEQSLLQGLGEGMNLFCFRKFLD